MEFIPIIVIAFLFWFLLIRPQSKRQRDMSRMQASLNLGDRVMLQSGLFATVFGIDEEQGRLQLELAPGVVVEAARAAVAQVDTPAERPDAEDPSPGANGADGPEPSDGPDGPGGPGGGTTR